MALAPCARALATLAARSRLDRLAPREFEGRHHASVVAARPEHADVTTHGPHRATARSAVSARASRMHVERATLSSCRCFGALHSARSQPHLELDVNCRACSEVAVFNLLVKKNGWNREGSDSIDITRVLEHTEDSIAGRFRIQGRIDFGSLQKLPTVLMSERSGLEDGDQTACVARITQTRTSQRMVHIEYTFDQTIPPIANESMFEMLTSLGALNEFECKRTHWAVKGVDLYECILRAQFKPHLYPTVFELRNVLGTRMPTIAVMMPFSSEFDQVFDHIESSIVSRNFQCKRADHIWQNESIIQDIVDLILASSAVIVDCTGRNANVFYEMGIAHTVGRPVIPIVQDRRDIPFDIRHLRHVRYHPNREGLQTLGTEIGDRLTGLGISR